MTALKSHNESKDNYEYILLRSNQLYIIIEVQEVLIGSAKSN